MRKRIANVAALLGALALAGALLAGAAALLDGARTAHAQESGGEQQQAGAEGSGAEAELTEWQKARIAEYQDAQTAQSGVSGQAEQGMISGLASVMNKGASDQFTVSATGLDPYFYYEYVFLVNSLRPDGGNSRGGIGFDSRCNSVVTSVRAPLRAKNHSATLTLYACSAGSYQVNSQLRLINHDEDPDEPERVTTLDTDIVTVTVRGTPTPTPPAPSNFRVTSTGQTSVGLAWNAQSQIMGFHIAGAPRAIYPSKSSTSATASNLRCGASYTFRIRAEGDNTNTQGWSPWSSYVSATTSACPTPTITISRNRASVTEGQSAQFTLRANHAPSSNLTVNVRVTQSGSFISGTPPTSVQISSGRTTGRLTVQTRNDSVDEPHGSITARVLDGTGYVVGTTFSAKVTVEDNEPDPTAEPDLKPSFSATISNKSWTHNKAISSFRLPAATDGDGTLSYSLSPALPSGVTRSNFTVRGTPSALKASTQYTWTATDRDGDTATRTFTIEVVPEVTIAAGTSPIAEGTTAQFTLTASAAPPSNLAVSVSVTQSGSFISGTAPTSVTIPANGTTATLSVPTLKDKVNEADGYVRASVRAGTNYAVGSTLPVSVSVRDTPYVSIAAGTSPITEGANATFTITAAGAPLSNMTVQVSVTESRTGSETYIKGTAPSSVTIPASSANQATATLTVATENDATDEPNGSITASIVANAAYELGSPSSASVNVQDNDLQKLAAPTGLTVTPLMPEDHRTLEWKARLDWGVVANRSRYQVEVRKTGGSWATASSGSVTDPSYKINLRSIVSNGDGLAQASAYQFRVKAIASGSTHADSDYGAVVEIRDTPIISINGDSSGRTDGKGQAVVTWGAVPGATAFTLRWRKLPNYTGMREVLPNVNMHVNAPHSHAWWLPTEAKTENDWSTSAPVGQSSSSMTVSGLDLNELYAFQLTYTHASGQGFAARESYVWPSTRSAGNSERIATLPLNDPLPGATYTYVICDETFLKGMDAQTLARLGKTSLAHLNDWKNLINHAIQQWQRATNSLVTVEYDSKGSCADYSVAIKKVRDKIKDMPNYSSSHIHSLLDEIGLLDITNTDSGLNEIIKLSERYSDLRTKEFAPRLRIHRCIINADACAPHIEGWSTTDIIITARVSHLTSLIIPGNDTQFHSDDVKFNTCSTIVYAQIVHEVGHALGIRDHGTGALQSVMNYEAFGPFGREQYAACSPHPLDVMLAYALYQVGGNAS